MGMDLDDAEEEMEETKPGDLDAEFLYIMGEIALLGIDRSKADARGEDEEGLREVLAVGELENEIGFVGGVTLEIAQDVINISQNSEDAESFRG
jgi:hypothetical protein